MAVNKKHAVTIDMCSGPILRNVLRFAVPVIIGNLMQMMFSAADMVVVGKFIGEDALAAIGANTSLTFLMLNIFVGLSIGVNVVTARYYGAGDERGVTETVHSSAVICLISGIFLAVFTIVAARFFLECLDTPYKIMDDAVLYLRVCAIGFPFTIIFNFSRAIVNAEGDTKFPLYSLVAAGAGNVVLDLIFVLILHMDVFGAALATSVSNALSASMMVVHLSLKTTMIRLNPKRIRFVRDKGMEIIKVGLPAGFQGIAFSVSNVIVQEAVNSFGAIVVAGNTAVINIEGFLYQAMYGFYQASGTFVSQNYGAKKYERIEKVMKVCLLCAFISGFALSIVAIVFKNRVIGIYSSSEAVIIAGSVRIAMIFPLYFLCGLNDVISGAMRGIGYSVVPFIISFTGACVFRVLWIFTVFDKYSELEVLYVSYPISWILTFLAHFTAFKICYKKVCRIKSR